MTSLLPDQPMLYAILACFITALLLLFFGHKIKGKASLLLSVLPLANFVYFASQVFRVSSGNTITQSHHWVPSLDVDLAFKLDGLSLIFALMITGIGTLVFVYTSNYLKGNPHLDRFYGYLSIFMGAMLGVVLSDNLIALFVFWELTSISSFFLIGFKNDTPGSRKSALTALTITGLGGLLLLGAVLIFGMVGGTYSFQEILNSGIDFRNHAVYGLLLFFVLGAAFTKSAQFPFHFWLPGAMKAPTPVSTYLHSATMVKAGIYLLLRFTPALNDTDLWHGILIIAGGITMVYAAFHTLFRTDLKGILAYSTISALGILVFLIGLGTQAALLAAVVFIIVHALYKATLFLVTGILDHETGTRDITKLSGLRKVLFPVAAAGLLAALSNAGIPPTIGFLGKDLIYEATLHHEDFGFFITLLAIVTNVLLLYAGFLVGIKPFRGTLPKSFEKVHLPSPLLWGPPLLLAVTGLIIGFFPQLIAQSLIEPALGSLLHIFDPNELKLWHGFNVILLLSVITILAGIVLFKVITPSKRKEKLIKRLDFIAPKNVFWQMAGVFHSFSNLWTRTFQNGYLRNYVLTIVLVLVGLIGYNFFNSASLSWDYKQVLQLTFYEVTVLFIMIVAIFFTVFTRSRLAAVAAMGVVGYAICLIFVFYSAPDLAMTQFTIDTLTVILFVLVLYRLPKYLKLSESPIRIRDMLVSLAFGTLITLLSLEVLQEPKHSEVGDFYAQNSYLLAKGKNVVNVILVDFRGLDTMVEVTVLTIAALGVFGLLKLRLRSKD